MYSLIISFIILVLITLPLAVKRFIKNIFSDNYKKSVFVFLTWVSILIFIAISIAVIPNIQTNNITDKGIVVAEFEDVTLYHNEFEDYYFYVETQNWNPVVLVKEIQIDKKLAESKLSTINDIKKQVEYTRFLFDKET